MNKIINSINKIDERTLQDINDLSDSMTEMEIVKSFNQCAVELYDILLKLANKHRMTKILDIDSYQILFNTSVKINYRLPIQKYVENILQFAYEIYNDKEEEILGMESSDEQINVGDQSGIIQIDIIKKLWKLLNDDDREVLKRSIIGLTTYSHAFFYKTN